MQLRSPLGFAKSSRALRATPRISTRFFSGGVASGVASALADDGAGLPSMSGSVSGLSSRFEHKDVAMRPRRFGLSQSWEIVLHADDSNIQDMIQRWCFRRSMAAKREDCLPWLTFQLTPGMYPPLLIDCDRIILKGSHRTVTVMESLTLRNSNQVLAYGLGISGPCCIQASTMVVFEECTLGDACIVDSNESFAHCIFGSALVCSRCEIKGRLEMVGGSNVHASTCTAWNDVHVGPGCELRAYFCHLQCNVHDGGCCVLIHCVMCGKVLPVGKEAAVHFAGVAGMDASHTACIDNSNGKFKHFVGLPFFNGDVHFGSSGISCAQDGCQIFMLNATGERTAVCSFKP